MSLGITDQNEIDEKVRKIDNLRAECTDSYVKAHQIVYDSMLDLLKLRRTRVVDEVPDEDGVAYNYVDLIELDINKIEDFNNLVKDLEGKTYEDVVKDFIIGYVNYEKSDYDLGEKYMYISSLVPLPVIVEFMVDNVRVLGVEQTLLLGVKPCRYTFKEGKKVDLDLTYFVGGVPVGGCEELDTLEDAYVVNIKLLGI